VSAPDTLDLASAVIHREQRLLIELIEPNYGKPPLIAIDWPPVPTRMHTTAARRSSSRDARAVQRCCRTRRHPSQQKAVTVMKLSAIPKPKLILGIVVAGIVNLLIFTSVVVGVTTGSSSPTPTPTPVAAPVPTSSPAPTRSATPTISVEEDSALWLALHLEIRYRDRRGYDRDEFGQAWADVDRNGCDQRNDVLRRDMRKRHTKPGTNGCVLAKGVLKDDPHSYASKVRFERGDDEIEIDHVVSLRDAWKSAAEGWRPSKREKFANDFQNLEAVDSETDQDKGDKAADQWLPKSEMDACYYVSRQVALKHRYRLTVTAAEKDTMVRVLNAPNCEGGEWEPDSRSYFKAPKPKPIGEPKPKP
jgi:hypothetical protein